MDYNLSALELNISDEGNKSTGILLSACQFTIDKKTGEIVAELHRPTAHAGSRDISIDGVVRRLAGRHRECPSFGKEPSNDSSPA
jgi:hypothetical protein